MEGQIDRLPELAAELVRLKVDVIVTWFTPTAVAAKQATREIPIVMAETGDPIGTGLVISLPRPGGNVTGIASVTAELAGKSVQLIRDMLPSARRVTALANATDPFSKPFLEQGAVQTPALFGRVFTKYRDHHGVAGDDGRSSTIGSPAAAPLT